MGHLNAPPALRTPLPRCAVLALLGAALFACSSSPSAHGSPSTDAGEAGPGAGACFGDSNGLTGGSYTFVLTVDDTGFSKMALDSKNNATVTLTLTNNGTMPHGFEVGCVDVLSAFPNLPAGCPTMGCFPTNSTIAPLAPGASTTITFFTPTPDGLTYPFASSAPADVTVPGLNDGQWSLM